MDLKLPPLGEGADSGTVVNLFVKEGDQITKDQPILELENEKAVATIPSTAAGVVTKVHVKSGDKLILDADEGDIHISGTDGQEMTVHIYQKGSEEYISKYRVSFDQAGDIVTIRGRHERKFFHFFDDISYGVRYEIQLPKDFNLNIQTSGGDLHVETVNGTIRGETSGGDVDGENLDGKVSLSTSGGNMKLYHSRGDIVLETSGGDIACDDVIGTMHVETSGGNIKFTKADGELHGTTSGGNIRVELASNKGVDLSTSGGNVVVSLPKSIAANVNAETTGGEVSCDFPFSGKLKDLGDAAGERLQICSTRY